MQLNFVAVSILELIGKLPRANRIKLYVSRIMYFFGVGGKKRGYLGMASTCSLPGLHGVFHAIMAWITFVALLALHIVYAIDFNDVKGVKRGAAMGFYWVCLTTWWWGLMIYFLKDTRGL